MCGLVGFVDLSKKWNGWQFQSMVTKMADTLIHRGPDDGGIWIEAESGLALGFRRLAIVDLSPTGHQPMVSASKRYVLVFNGEIYNFRTLRKELETYTSFSGNSDTEIMLAAFEEWGLEGALKRFVGMFAFALWDSHKKQLHLVRDRLGEKPLYYGVTGSHVFLFASELKAFKAHPTFNARLNYSAIAGYLRYSYVPAPLSIYENVFKIPPGHILTMTPFGSALPKPVPYWSVDHLSSVRQGGVLSEHESLRYFDELLTESIVQEMVADVPLGAFLSGGIDSSLIVAIMQRQSSRPVKTFTIGFKESAYNEAPFAKKIAEYLGTEHTEIYLGPREVLDVVPKLASLYDEPFADSSQIPTFLVSSFARKYVTVCLSGDGGDELFGGYSRYLRANNICTRLKYFPPSVRGFAADALSRESFGKLIEKWRPFLPPNRRRYISEDNAKKFSALLEANNNFLAMYEIWLSKWNGHPPLMKGGFEPLKSLAVERGTFLDSAMRFDLATYLPDDILTKVDRASMGVSLEVRAPFLDHRVVEFAVCLPLRMKFRKGKGKWLPRELLQKYVPKELTERPKMGFSIPIDQWLRGPLYDWAENLLENGRLKNQGIFDPAPIRNKWKEHCAGRNWSEHLWDILIFQAWLDHEEATQNLQHDQEKAQHFCRQ